MYTHIQRFNRVLIIEFMVKFQRIIILLAAPLFSKEETYIYEKCE